jgi:molybdopterin adenylyltransferase
MSLSIAIATVGNRYVSGNAKDEAGDILASTLTRLGWNIVKREFLPDEEETVVAWMANNADSTEVDVVLTVDGIGLTPVERVPEAMYRVCEKWLPGVSEVLRIKAYEKTPAVALSRGVAGIRGNTILVNLPGGSPGVIKDVLEVLKPILRNAVEILKRSTTMEESSGVDAENG